MKLFAVNLTAAPFMRSKTLVLTCLVMRCVLRRAHTCLSFYITNTTPTFLLHSCLHVLMDHTWVSEILDRSCDFWNSTCLFVPTPFLAMSSTLSVWLLRVRDLVRVRSGENSNAFTVLFKLSYCCFC
jgi:hypothetical protein